MLKKISKRLECQNTLQCNEFDFKKAKKIPHSEVDLVVVDLGDSWNVVPQARKMLKGSGGFVAICPTMNQLEKLVQVLVQNEFSDIECTEQILRHIEAREGKTRHSFRGIGHTTYLAYARKAFFDKKPIKKSKKVKAKTVSKKKIYSSKK